MRIGIDARVLEKRMTGIGRYLLDILKGYPSFDPASVITLYSVNEINFSDLDITNNSFKLMHTGKHLFPDKFYSPFWLNLVLPSLIKESKVDLFFAPNHLLPISKLKCKSVIAIHDLHHLTNKMNHSYFYRNYLNFQLPCSVKNADVIIAISESTKNDLITNFAVSPEKIKIIHRAADKKFKPSVVSKIYRKRLNLPDKFVLYVGVIENRKNIIGILRTADILFSKRMDIKFVLVGKPGFGFKEIEKEIIKRKNVIYLNYLEEQDIVSLYNLAFIFFFPSHYEGFGLPPLEAMQCGIPVICSSIPSIKEVVGNSGFLREPKDYNGFAEDIMRLITNPTLYSEMKNRSINQSKIFSADKSLKKMAEIFSNLKN